MVRKLNPRGNIKGQGYGKFHFVLPWLFLSFFCLCIIYSQPCDFPCVIKPRFQYAVELINSSSGLDLVE